MLRQLFFGLAGKSHGRPFERRSVNVFSTQVVEHLGSDDEILPRPLGQVTEISALLPGRHDELPLKVGEFPCLHAAPGGYAERSAWGVQSAGADEFGEGAESNSSGQVLEATPGS